MVKLDSNDYVGDLIAILTRPTISGKKLIDLRTGLFLASLITE